MKAKKAIMVITLALGLGMSVVDADLTLPYEDSTSYDGAVFKITNEEIDPASGKTWAGYFEAWGPEGRGITGRCTSTVADVDSYGGLFYAAGPQGRGVLGQSAGWQEGIGVKGWASNEGDVQNFGGHFCATGMQGIGVYGWAENTGDVENYGGYFLAQGNRGIGLFAMGGPYGSAGVFEGDLKITGAGNALVFPDGSRQITAAKSSTNGGMAPAGAFPRPAYNSGWVKLPWDGHQGGTVELVHNLGGDPDNYFVDLQFRSFPTEEQSGAIHNEGHGGDRDEDGIWEHSKGAYYHELNATSVKVTSSDGATYWTQRARVRIWVYE